MMRRTCSAILGAKLGIRCKTGCLRKTNMNNESSAPIMNLVGQAN